MTPHLDAADLPPEVLTELRLYDLTVEDIDRWLRANGSDGDTGVPNLYPPASYLHDYFYRTAVVDRETADRLYYQTLVWAADGDEWPWRLIRRVRAWWRWRFLRRFSAMFYRKELREE